MSKPLTDLMKQTEKELFKFKKLVEAYPTIKYSNGFEFTDKSVNKTYQKFEFEDYYGTLSVLPYSELSIKYPDDTIEVIKIHSSPKRNRLAYISWRSDPVTKKKKMKFSRLAINMKNNEFKEEMFNACKTAIMTFVQKNPGHQLDTKHLDPRLKKLLAFI